MSNISGLSSSNIAAYSAPVQRPVAPAATPSNPSTVTSLNTSSNSAPTTYNATGQLNASQKSAAAAAQNAVLATQNALTQTLDSLMSGSQSSASTTDMFGNATGTNDPLAANTPAPASGGITAQAAQSAYLATQNMITQSLNSI
ncbi:MAG: hypothetical protein WCK93_06430 [Nitrosomonadales bacterium]